MRTLRESVKQAKKDYDKTEDDLKALQSVGQIIGEVLRQLDDERCACPSAHPIYLLSRDASAVSNRAGLNELPTHAHVTAPTAYSCTHCLLAISSRYAVVFLVPARD